MSAENSSLNEGFGGFMKQVGRILGIGLLTGLSMCVQMLAADNKADLQPLKLNVGDVAPDFKLQYFDGSKLKDVSLSQYRDKSNVVVAFYIFAFTGG